MAFDSYKKRKENRWYGRQLINIKDKTKTTLLETSGANDGFAIMLYFKSLTLSSIV